MLRAALFLCLVAGAVWAIGVYRLGDKPLSGHLKEIYRSDLVQQKVEALERGIDQRLADHVEKAKQEPKRRVVTKEAKPAPAIDPPPSPAPPKVIDVRPTANKPKATPAHDQLTDSDRQNLDALLSEKLKH